MAFKLVGAGPERLWQRAHCELKIASPSAAQLTLAAKLKAAIATNLVRLMIASSSAFAPAHALDRRALEVLVVMQSVRQLHRFAVIEFGIVVGLVVVWFVGVWCFVVLVGVVGFGTAAVRAGGGGGRGGGGVHH